MSFEVAIVRPRINPHQHNHHVLDPIYASSQPKNFPGDREICDIIEQYLNDGWELIGTIPTDGAPKLIFKLEDES